MLILASNSPRRRQLMEVTGWDYQVLAACVDESVQPNELPEAYVLRLAQEKAQATAPLIPPADKSQAVILAADTTVALGGDIMGKPADAIEAEVMLSRLRDCSHQVYTGLCVLRASDGLVLSETVATQVNMRDYTVDEMRAYIASGDPFDKAGAYAVQHAEFHPVQNLQGCYANVMGLPVCHLRRMLVKLGLQPGKSAVDACASAVDACESTLDRPCDVILQLNDQV